MAPTGQRLTETREILILGFRLIILGRANRASLAKDSLVHCTLLKTRGWTEVSTECWDIQHIPVLPKMLAFKLIFSRQKTEIVFSEDSKLKYTSSGVQNKQTEMPHQITPSKAHAWQSRSRQRASIYFTFFLPVNFLMPSSWMWAINLSHQTNEECLK